ncbi:hypothetical protein [Actinoplanes sp. NBRC 103695]|uniref:hypothetical protein n=1 Tax=Actinoplanes sp. NBRC 103695 TaxID=3032202 RepID=UPI0024A58FB4|nr:hypothetical protein [Actinoplanes sp. NBRC 103695]GLZ00783.1 hypothetical protein Acsp02_80350 [Actinoplanes sp. NBRC 103695]
MGRVEWTRLEGNDVEAVVAMFVNRERPNSVRISTSRGDGGIDILERGAGPAGGDDVHQVKCYCGPLTARQKEEVKKSLARLTTDPRWKSLKVERWYLVTPWDPTPEAEAWLQELAAGYEFTAVWHGLAYVEQLAAKYPDVVDYYLHGGKTAIEDAYQAVAAMFALGGNPQQTMDIPSVTARVQAALPVLDTDPHYRYELHFGSDQPPPPADRPRLVMSWLSSRRGGGPWVAVDVIARCAASTDERPITITGQLAADNDSTFAEDLRDSAAFGTPFTSPAGAFTGEIDAPGGLGGPLANAQIMSLPIDDLGANPQLHVQIIDPAGTVLSTADLDRTDRSQGTDGVRVVLQEVHHVFQVEDRYRLPAASLKRTFRLADPANLVGEPPAAVLAALQFLNVCRTPNTARASVRHTPPERGTIDRAWILDLPDEWQKKIDFLTEAIGALATIQQHTSTPIRVPDLTLVTFEQHRRWILAAHLLAGKEVLTTYPDGQCLVLELGSDVDVPNGGTIGMAVPLNVVIDGATIELGGMEIWLNEATLVRREQRGDRTYHLFTTPGRRYRCLPAPEEND